jgi:hypothetical protein
MPFIVGGLAAASSIMSGIGGASQSKANAIAARMQQDQQNFQNKWQNEAQNRNLLRQWEAQYFINKQIERGANQQLTMGKVYARDSYKNEASLLSKQTRQANNAFLGSVSAKGMSLDSASARALLRQSVEESQTISRTMRTNFENQMRDLETNYQNVISGRDLNVPEQQTLLTSKAVVADASSSMLMTGIATGLLSGASAGIGAYSEYGWDKSVSGRLSGK